jgi:hypothetical protein
MLATYERNTMANQHYTREKFLKSKMEPRESFDAYLARVTQLKLRLAQMNAPVSDADLRWVLIEGLPSTFDALALKLKMEKEMTVEDVCEAIRDFAEDNSKKIAAALAAKEEEAHWVQPKARYRPEARGQKKNVSSGSSSSGPTHLSCHCCSKVGHVMFDCPQLPSTALKCKRCRRLGHTEDTCRGGRNFNRGGPKYQPQQRGKKADESDDEVAAAAREMDTDEDWGYFAEVVESAAEERAEAMAFLSGVDAARASLPSHSAWKRPLKRESGFVLDTGTTVDLSKSPSKVCKARS